MNVSEIIQKEDERHQLIRLGVIDRLQDAIDILEAGCPFSELNDWTKNDILRFFYNNVIKYASFIACEKATNLKLKRTMFRKSSDLLQAFRKNEAALLDKELKINSKLTVAFHISDVIYESIYSSFCLSSQRFENPDETCSFFLGELKQRYPLYIHDFVELIEQDDSSLWEVTCRYLQQLSYYVVSQYSGTYSDIGYHDIICDETWSKAYDVLRKRIVEKEGNVPSFQTGKDFRNYMIKTCRYLAENLHKKYAKKESVLDDLLTDIQYDEEGEITGQEYSLPFDPEASVEFERFENEVKELEIDTENTYEVAYAVSIILLNKEHTLHQPLVQGIEDKIELLINKAVNNMSYQEIVAVSCENRTDDDAFRRAVAKARKDYERIRKTLAGRLIELIEKRKKCHIRQHKQMY